MGKQETQSTVVWNDNPTVDINTENWPENARSWFGNLVTRLIPSAEFVEGSVSIPKNVLNTRVELHQVLNAVLQLEWADWEPIFPGIEPTLQQLRVALRDVDLDSIKTVFENVEGLKDVFLDPQNVEILSTIFEQGPVIKICENINRLYGETGWNDDKNKDILKLNTEIPELIDPHFSSVERFAYNLKAKVEIPGDMNKDNKEILSDWYTKLFEFIIESLNEQIKQWLIGKINGWKVDEIEAILPFLWLVYNGITIHTKGRDNLFYILINLQKNNNIFKVEGIEITWKDDYAKVIKTRIDFLKKIENLLD